MKIRRLYLTDAEDFTAELKSGGIEISANSLKNYLPSHFIFKFYDMPDEMYQQLLLQFTERGYPCWSNPIHTSKSILVSLSDWDVLETFTEGPAYSELKRIKENGNHDNWEFALPGGQLKIDRPLIMGILNITPDSFSDGGKFFHTDDAVTQAERMIAQGADIIDIGAESTRPGSVRVELEEEWQRLKPVLTQIKQITDIPISIDTYKSEIARRALDLGADLINDISGMTFDKEMARIIERAGCPVILMHIKGTPREMQKNPHYENLMEELHEFFRERISFCNQMKIRQVIIDPGIGFGKRLADNYEIIRRLPEFKSFGHPVLIGPSRKSFIGKVLKNETPE